MAFNPLSLLVLKFRGRSAAVFRDHCTRYESILAVAQRSFRSLHGVPVEDIVLLSTIPGYPEQDQVELSKEIWSAVSTVVHTVTIALESEMQASNTRRPSSDLPNYRESRTSTSNGPGGSPLIPLPLPQPTATGTRPPPTRPDSWRPPSSWPVQPHDSADEEPELMLVRKPIIYLYPPSSLPDVTVKLLLTSAWSFSAVYPPPQTSIPSASGERKTAQALTWAIAAEPNGTLVDKTTGAEVSYLYWEATANPNLMTPNTSRAATPVGDLEAFDPARPSVSPSDSILLPMGKVPGYLDTALKALALHTEARTSFITYWLPDLLKHEYVALRFLAQASYEQAAKMRVSPAPDVVTRVFMLFRGVAPGDLGLWGQATARVAAEDGATFWTNVVGIDSARASDHSVFRVLEWGGMEVK